MSTGTLGYTTVRSSPPDNGHESQRNILRLLDSFRVWCGERKDRVDDCCVVGESDALAFYVITKAVAYDFGLNKELAAFVVSLKTYRLPVVGHLVPSSSALARDIFRAPFAFPLFAH